MPLKRALTNFSSSAIRSAMPSPVLAETFKSIPWASPGRSDLFKTLERRHYRIFNFLCYVNRSHPDNNIGSGGFRPGALHADDFDLVTGLGAKARRIRQDDGNAAKDDWDLNDIPGSAGTRRNDCRFPGGNQIQQGRFADIRRAGKNNFDAGAKCACPISFRRGPTETRYQVKSLGPDISKRCGGNAILFDKINCCFKAAPRAISVPSASPHIANWHDRACGAWPYAAAPRCGPEADRQVLPPRPDPSGH